MANNFSLSTSGVSLSTTLDLKTLITAATGAGSVVALYEVSIGGEAASSSVARLVVNRPGTAGITPNTTQTPERVSPSSAAATFTCAGSTSAVTNWGTQPVLSTNDVLVPIINAFGGVYRWQAIPGSEVIVGTQGAVANLSFRSRSGTATISGHFLVSEC
jgi:hypothetical protein